MNLRGWGPPTSNRFAAASALSGVEVMVRASHARTRSATWAGWLSQIVVATASDHRGFPVNLCPE
jgi:hypothetical protein